MPILHKAEDQLESMSRAFVFTVVDLTKGYHQVKLEEESWEIIKFLSPKCLF